MKPLEIIVLSVAVAAVGVATTEAAKALCRAVQFKHKGNQR